MKSKKYLIALAFVGAVVLSGFHAKEDPEFLLRLKEQLIRFTNSYPEEKLYVQFDKPFYKPEEEIWFNATVLNSNTHRPASTSDVLYLELIDPKGNVVSKQEALITEGTAHGSFELLDSAPGGIYRVNGYTTWMKNFGSDNYFTKELTVQKVITPRMLLKLDYEKESYGAGENVKAKLSIRNLKNQKVNDATVRLIIRIAGKQVGELKLTSNNEGEANLNFVLPDDLTTTDGLLVAVVASDGVEESISRSVPIVLNNIDLQFFPEGGQWVENVSSTIAFKALNEFGKGADVKGSIVDEQNNVVTTFESFHMGMGAFELRPVAGKKYFAQINSPVQRKDRIPLPVPVKDGVSFHLAQQKASTTEWIINAPAKGEYFIVAQVHGEIVHSSSHDVGRGSNTIKIETSEFPSGIAAFTLFDNTGKPHCERLLFVQPEKGLVINVKPEKEFYEPRERVKIKVETKDFTGKPVRAKLSMAVADDQVISFADDKQDNILSYFMLSSEVKGDIQEPSFYFDPEEPKAKKALDYLLMTQGWRRFSWSDIYKERAITYAPEKLTMISGRVVDNNNNGLEQEVTYIETGNRKRVAQVKSTGDGYFVVRNIDPSTEIFLMTKRPGQIILEKGKSMLIEQLTDEPIAGRYDENAEVTRDAVDVTKEEEESVANDVEETALEGGDLDLDMNSDVTQLSEVVVVGFGVEERKSIAGALVSVKKDDLSGGFTLPSVESALQGRAAGLTVTTSGNPAAMGNIRIRGMSSLASGRSEPLYVINGHPMASALNGNFSNGSMVAPEEIESIHVMPSPEATAIFGAAGSNGAIMINTNNKLNYQYNNFGSKEKKPKYNTFTIVPRKFSPVREFYVPPVNSSVERNDFRTTIHWAHTLVTDDKGIAEVSFDASDAVSAFRITTEGFSGNGLIGRNESVYSTQLPVSIDTKIPQTLGFEDVLKLPVMIRNERPAKMSGVVAIELPAALSLSESTHIDVEVPAGETKTIWYTIRPQGVQGTFPVVIKTAFAGVKDQIKQDIVVRSVGFPREFSVSAKEIDKTFNVSVQDAEDKSIHAQLNVFPDVLSDLFEGAESILQEPHGCFEQVSSSTFPNILALQFMKESGKITPEIEKKALDYIRTGYKMLAGYEIRSGGFEWFGHPPAHEGLTGYGLIEFYEMAKVFSGVDQTMVHRTRKWLLSRKDGKGGFEQNDQGYDSFSGSSGSVGNAYILYALSETGHNDDIAFEYTTAASEAWKSKDMYRLALVANTAYNLGKYEDYRKFVSYFEQHVSAEGIAVLTAQESMVHSYGNSLRTETLALWTLALLKDVKTYQPLIAECVNELITYRSFGGFGSTQGTVLALKVLAEYARWAASTKADGTVEVVINDKVADRLAYTEDARGTLTASAFTNALSSDKKHAIRVRFVGSSSPLPYSMNIRWYARTPLSDPACHLDIETAIEQPIVRVNETARLNVAIRNKSAKGLPMAIAIIGIPSGLSLQPWQLKEMQEKGVFDFYEITNGNLVVYYRSVGASATKVIDLDLKAEVPGEFKATASSACLYYANEFKDWEAGVRVKIIADGR